MLALSFGQCALEIESEILIKIATCTICLSCCFFLICWLLIFFFSVAVCCAQSLLFKFTTVCSHNVDSLLQKMILVQYTPTFER